VIIAPLDGAGSGGARRSPGRPTGDEADFDPVPFDASDARAGSEWRSLVAVAKIVPVATSKAANSVVVPWRT
jgi:hypothetical protein